MNRHCIVTDRRGTSAVEFALLAPVYLLLVMGMAAYGIYLAASHSVQQLAADAARVAIAGLDSDERAELVRAFIDDNGGGYAFISHAKLDVAAAPSTLDPAQFVISLRYDASDLPVWNLFPGLSMPGTTIVRASTIRNGGM